MSESCFAVTLNDFTFCFFSYKKLIVHLYMFDETQIRGLTYYVNETSCCGRRQAQIVRREPGRFYIKKN